VLKEGGATLADVMKITVYLGGCPRIGYLAEKKIRCHYSIYRPRNAKST